MPDATTMSDVKNKHDSSRAAVFLDRDGTLIVEKHYLSDPDAVSLETGVGEGLELLARLGHPLIVVSNQSGIGRGMFEARDAERVNDRVAELLRQRGVHIAGWYVCPHVPEDGCGCRKPEPGMALAAARDLDLALEGCFVIGDKRADLELADAIGGLGLLVSTGHGRECADWARAQSRPVFDDLGGAARFIAAAGAEDAPGAHSPPSASGAIR